MYPNNLYLWWTACNTWILFCFQRPLFWKSSWVCKFHASIPEMAGKLQHCFQAASGICPQTFISEPLPHPQSAGMCGPQPWPVLPRLFIEIPREESSLPAHLTLAHLPSHPHGESNSEWAASRGRIPDTSWDPGEAVPAAWACSFLGLWVLPWNICLLSLFRSWFELDS